MTHKGHIENGVIVPDEPIKVKNGTSILFEFSVEPSSADARGTEDGEANPSLTQLLSRFAGRAQTLPEDAAENLDHYLYGVPKK